MRVKWSCLQCMVYQVVQVVPIDRRIFMMLGGFGETSHHFETVNRLYTAWEDIP